jgi:hypothetical protein
LKSIIILFMSIFFLHSQEQMYAFKEISQLNQVYKKYIYRYFIAYEKLNANSSDKNMIKEAFLNFQKLVPSTMSKNEQKAYWINLYNITVIQEIVENYPVKSINDIPNVFTKKIVTVEGERLALDDIEKQKLRTFDDPRYHFAIVCAAISCPNIIPELYEGNRINYQLEMVTHDFINNAQKNDTKSKVVMLSKLFDWYGDEFKRFGGIKGFINQYMTYDERLTTKRTIKFIEFDWRLNGEVTARNLNRR